MHPLHDRKTLTGGTAAEKNRKTDQKNKKPAAGAGSFHE